MTGNNKVRSILLAALMVFSVFAGAIALSGAAAADEEIEANGFYVQGQMLYYDAQTNGGASSGDNYVLTDADSTPVGEYQVNDSGIININTANLDAGSYTLEAAGGNTDSISFYLGEQDLDASFEDGSVVLDSNRADFTVSASSDDLTDSELESLLQVEDSENIEVTGNSETFDIDESAVSSGSYDIDFDVTDTDVSANVTVDVGEVQEPDVNFNQSVFETDRGDIAEITIDFENGATGPVTLNIGSESVNYIKTVEVSPNSDGQAVVQFNTYSGEVTADEGSIGTTTTEVGSDGLLDAHDYDMNITEGDEEQDVGTLIIKERSTDSFDISVATGTQEYSEVSDVENASVDRDSVVTGDVVVLRLEASGLEGALGDQASTETTGQFFDLIDSNAADLTVEETNPGPNEGADTLTLDSSNTNVVSEDGVYYILVDTSAVSEAEVGSEYNATFTLDADSELVEEDETLTGSFSVVEDTLTLDTEEVNDEDQVVVRAENNQTISGDTDYAPGAEVRVVVRATGDNPFLLDDNAEVQEDGSFAAEFDFSDYGANTTFTVDADAQTPFDASAEATGVIQPAPSADVSIEDQETDGSSATVASASLSEGGFIAIYQGDSTGESSLLGVSDYIEGDNSDVEVSFDENLTEDTSVTAVAHMDSDGNQEFDFAGSEGDADQPYTSDGNPVSDTAQLTLNDSGEGEGNETNGSDNGTDTPDTPDDTPTTTEEPATDTPTEDDDTPTEDEEQPGFGIVVALVALVAAALLAVRREN